jgi:hypothetical protein
MVLFQPAPPHGEVDKKDRIEYLIVAEVQVMEKIGSLLRFGHGCLIEG